MSKKTLQVTFYMLIGAIFIFTALGCPGETETPAPAGEDPAPTTENGEQPPQAGEPVSTINEQLVETIMNFFAAMSEVDFDKASEYCTEELWEDEFKGFKEAYERLDEEKKARMQADYALVEEQHADLTDAVFEITGDTATLTITKEDESQAVFGFVMEDGIWKIASFE